MLARTRKPLFIIPLVIVGLLLAVLLSPLPAGFPLSHPVAHAQWNPQAWATGQSYLRQGPDFNAPILAGLPEGAALMLEGRSQDNAWVLGHTYENAARGWVQVTDLVLLEDCPLEHLPLSGEQVTARPAVGIPGETPAPANPAAAPALNPNGPVVSLISNLNIRTGPATTYDSVGVAAGGSDFVLEARNRGGSWVLGHTADGALRGWLTARYLRWGTVDVITLPEVNADGGIPPMLTPEPYYTPTPTPDFDALPRRTDRITLDFPWETLSYAQGIFERGQTFGNDPQAFILIGDSTTAGNQYTLPLFHSITHNLYDLGQYPELQTTIDFFRATNSFDTASQTARSGQATAHELDPNLADPAVCLDGETPLACEIRLKRPSVAIIYIGFVELARSTHGAYLEDLNMVLEACVANGVIPILTTLTATNEGILRHAPLEQYENMNQVIRTFADSYHVPLIDLNRYAAQLPNRGVIFEEGIHLSYRVDGAVNFTGDEWLYGKDLRTLLTLQALDILRREVLTPELQ